MRKELGIIAQLENDPTPFGKQTIYFQDMVNFGFDLPVTLFVFSPIDWIENTNKILAYSFENGKWSSYMRTIPKIIYDRFTAKSQIESDKILKFREYLKRNNYNFLINPDLAELLRNKLKFHEFLIANNLPTINGFHISNITQNKLIELFNYNDTIYIKPISGSGGFGIAICEKNNDKAILKTTTETLEINVEELANILVSKFSNNYFIQTKALTDYYNNCPYDIRVLIQNYGNKNYEITGIVVRVGQQGAWVSNLNSGGKGIAYEELENYFIETYKFHDLKNIITKICLDCCLKLDEIYDGFAEIAFDILLTFDKGPIIIEGNSKPARWVFNSIASNYELNSEQDIKYKELRKKTVILPLIYVTNNKFKSMETLIEIMSDTDENAVEYSQDLHNWLVAEKTKGVSVEKIQNTSSENMGAIETALLLFIAARPLLIEVIKSVNVWIQERKPKASVKITDKDTGEKFELNVENTKDIDEIIKKIVGKIK
jgi:glutathione synthase/RimK-type ligase-like ATP-grasp enzyme